MNITPTTERPKMRNQRVYITARDAMTNKARSTTLYNTTPEQAIDLIRRATDVSSVSESGEN